MASVFRSAGFAPWLAGAVCTLLLSAGPAAARTYLLFPVDGAVVNQPGGVVVGFCDDPEVYAVELKLNKKTYSVDLWDGVFDIDLDWQPGENQILVGGIRATFRFDSFADAQQVPSVHQAMLDNCGNCHLLGDALDLGLVAESAGKLCEKCHETVQGEGEHPASVACDACHVPHTSPLPGLARKDDLEACRTCHPRPTTGAQTDGHHAGNWSRLDCKPCHLQPFGNGGCHGCHPAQSKAGPTVHDKVAERRRCVHCHVPHRAAGAAVAQACKSCHGSVTAAAAGHVELTAGACARCHTLHAAQALKPAAESCLACHTALAGTEHAPPPATCAPCHAVHAAAE